MDLNDGKLVSWLLKLVSFITTTTYGLQKQIIFLNRLYFMMRYVKEDTLKMFWIRKSKSLYLMLVRL
jgi:hypothetical protein